MLSVCMCAQYLVLDDHVGLYKVSGMSYVALVVVHMLMLLGMYTQSTYEI